MTESSSPNSDASQSSANASQEPPIETPRERVLLIGHPKIVFMYPTFFAAILAGIFMSLFGGAGDGQDASAVNSFIGLAFLGISALNLTVLTFDFPRTTSLTLFFFLAFVGMGSFLTFHFNPELLPVVGNMIHALKPVANAHFYFLFAGVLFLLYLGVVVSVRFDYWEVRPNELLHHHGFLSDLKRYPAPSLRIDKEINDVFEYMLLGSGRLILHPQEESRAIVIDNVLFITRKEQQLTNMLGALQVSVRAN